MKVVLAEKPSVARDIAEVLGATIKHDGYIEGNGYQITWAIGHLIKLADTKAYGFEKWSLEYLPIIPESFKYEIDSDKKKQFNVIKGLFNSATEIICATDAGREGELIFRYIYLLSGSKTPFKRLWISSLTDEAITDGFKNLKDGNLYNSLYNSAKSRSEADWLVGINGTQTFTLNSNIGSVLSVGRVQTPVLAMICSRFIENTNFKPEAYYQIFVKSSKDSISFKATHPTNFNSEQEAKNSISKVGDKLTVEKYETKEKKEAAPRLFDLPGLQQEANKKHGLSAQQTLDAAQELYEKKFITYPRTGSQFLSTDMESEMPKVLSMIKKTPYEKFVAPIASKPLPKTPFNNEKVTDHHAIIPTPVSLSGEVNKNSQLVYELVLKRFLAAFSSPCVKDVTTVVLVSNGINFVASGNVIKDAGWSAIYMKDSNSEEEEETDSQNLPILSIGESISTLEKNFVQKFTKPKPLHNESSLLKLMETAGKEIEEEELRDAIKDCGIGTPATRASIIETILDRDYVIRQKKNLIPTEKGLQVYNLLKNNLISKVELTGQWEKKLNEMAVGKYQPKLFIDEIKNFTKELTQELKLVKVESKKTTCPKCQTLKLAFFDSYLKCSECQFSVSKTILKKRISDTDITDLITKKKTKIIKGFISPKTEKSFEASLIIKDDFSIGFEMPSAVSSSIKLSCPKCKESLINGTSFLSCGCGFKLWTTIADKKLSEKNITDLLTKGITEEIKGFTSKTSKKFDAKIKLNSEFKPEFEFPKK